jgi:hypothetical protein
MERRSYKPEVEGSSPSLGTKQARVPGIGLLNRTSRAGRKGTRFNSSAGFHKPTRLCSSTGKSKRLISARLVVRIHPQPPKLPGR